MHFWPHIPKFKKKSQRAHVCEIMTCPTAFWRDLVCTTLCVCHQGATGLVGKPGLPGNDGLSGLLVSSPATRGRQPFWNCPWLLLFIDVPHWWWICSWCKVQIYYCDGNFMLWYGDVSRVSIILWMCLLFYLLTFFSPSFREILPILNACHWHYLSVLCF